MAEFTKGPWQWIRRSDFSVLAQGIDERGLIIGEVHDDGSAAGEYGPSIDVNGPDARLIAAAPDLYEACEIMLPFLEENCIGEDRIRLVRNAIAKAKGGSPDGN